MKNIIFKDICGHSISAKFPRSSTVFDACRYLSSKLGVSENIIFIISPKRRQNFYQNKEKIIHVFNDNPEYTMFTICFQRNQEQNKSLQMSENLIGRRMNRSSLLKCPSTDLFNLFKKDRSNFLYKKTIHHPIYHEYRNVSKNIPYDFQDMVDEIAQLGFPIEDIKEALRESQFNPQFAINILLSRNTNEDSFNEDLFGGPYRGFNSFVLGGFGNRLINRFSRNSFIYDDQQSSFSFAPYKKSNFKFSNRNNMSNQQQINANNFSDDDVQFGNPFEIHPKRTKNSNNSQHQNNSNTKPPNKKKFVNFTQDDTIPSPPPKKKDSINYNHQDKGKKYKTNQKYGQNPYSYNFVPKDKTPYEYNNDLDNSYFAPTNKNQYKPRNEGSKFGFSPKNKNPYNVNIDDDNSNFIAKNPNLDYDDNYDYDDNHNYDYDDHKNYKFNPSPYQSNDSNKNRYHAHFQKSTIPLENNIKYTPPVPPPHQHQPLENNIKYTPPVPPPHQHQPPQNNIKYTPPAPPPHQHQPPQKNISSKCDISVQLPNSKPNSIQFSFPHKRDEKEGQELPPPPPPQSKYQSNFAIDFNYLPQPISNQPQFQAEQKNAYSPPEEYYLEIQQQKEQPNFQINSTNQQDEQTSIKKTNHSKKYIPKVKPIDYTD